MESQISIEMFPAGVGDCFLLHLGNENWLIDSGYVVTTYQEHLRERLIEIAKNSGEISRMIITHIDRDHISGAIRLLKENGKSDDPKIIPIKQIWHNSFRHMEIKIAENVNLSKSQIDELKRILKKFTLKIADPNSGKEVRNPVSTRQGTLLSGHILKNGYLWNTDFLGKAVIRNGSTSINTSSAVKVHVLTPTCDSLQELGSKWINELLPQHYQGPLTDNEIYFGDAIEALAAIEMEKEEKRIALEERISTVSSTKKSLEKLALNAEHTEDTALGNGSSISFLLEYSGRKMLFLGDAHPSKVLAGLKNLRPQIELPIHVDVLKLSHHGSFRSNSPELLKSVSANYYLISTNGAKPYYHPNEETIATICYYHPKKTKVFVFNYPIRKSLKWILDKNLQNKFKYSVLEPIDIEPFLLRI